MLLDQIQRQYPTLQGKVTELEDEVRWHAQHAASAPKLPNSIRQLHATSGVSQKPEQHQASNAPHVWHPLLHFSCVIFVVSIGQCAICSVKNL